MEENPEQKTPEAAPEQAPEAAPEAKPETPAEAPAGEKAPEKIELPPLPEKPVKVTITDPGVEGVKPAKAETIELELHTPSILRAVAGAPEGCTVKIEIAQYQTEKGEAELKPGEKPKVTVGWRNAFEGARDDAVKQLSASVIAAQDIPRAIHNYLKYVFDNSDLKACAVSVVVATPDGKDATAAFVVPGNHCTNAQAVELVNVMDANTNEFVTKAKLEIPGRNAPKMGGLIIPSAEDREKFGGK